MNLARGRWRGARALIGITTFAVVACHSRPDASADKENPTPVPSGSASAAPSASVRSAAWYVGTWEGTYTTLVATPSIEPGFGLSEWSRNPGTHGVGSGSVTLSVSLDGTVAGQAKGAMGPQRVGGVAEESSLRLELAPGAPTDAGFTGVVVVARGGDAAVSGSFRASGGNSRWVREGDLQLKKQ